MRLNQISVVNNDGYEYVILRFRDFSLKVELPSDWGAMSRADKINWGKDYLANHLLGESYRTPETIVYPDEDTREISKDDFENLPGWAAWTAAEASAWIDANVVDLASAKGALKAMAKAIVYLRNITVEQ